MIPLSEEQLQFLLEELAWEEIRKDGVGQRLQKRVLGYRDGIAGKTQAVVSMMLEAKVRARQEREARDGGS